MTPKFRGDSEDWLDEEATTRQSPSGQKKSEKKTKKKSQEALEIPLARTNATVTEVFPNQCRVSLDDGQSLLCSYRRTLLLRESTARDGSVIRERTPVAVGDRVQTSVLSDRDAVIEGSSKRTNQLIRHAPSRGESSVHVIVANIDLLIIVAATTKPEFTPGLIDRFLIAAQVENIPALLCVNKIDLFEPNAIKPWQLYSDLEIKIFEISAKFNIGIQPLMEQIQGKTVVFCGHSGVGKTALLRQLTGTQMGRVGQVSEQTGKGQHTTVSTLMMKGPGGSRWIDTPGVKELGLLGLEPEGLAAHFPEFATLSCAAHECLHEDESHCQASSLPRYPSYRRILDSLRAGEY